jgi:glycosyltransferase involved in cell wall biosynthesis
MADIGVLHGPITAGGGAESVAVNTIVGLQQAGHDVTLYTTDTPSLQRLNERYDVSIDGDLRTVTVETPAVQAVDIATTATGVLGVTDMPLLRKAMFERVVARRYGDDHELLVCTHGECGIDGAVEYIHFPYFSRDAMQQYGTRFDERLYPTYHALCRLSKRQPRDPSSLTTLTNSRWTATVIESVTERSPRVLHPPVETDGFDPQPWAERESGFVSIGRLHPLKRQHELVAIVDALQERGYDEIALHIVGGVGDETYAQRLAALADTRPYIHLEGEVTRSALVDLLETNRYGLHGRRFEHFGIAVAEMVAAGMLPFVHGSGGQQEVVRNTEELLYTDIDDAVATIAAVLDSDSRQARLRDHLTPQRGAYGRSRFRRQMHEIVEVALDTR